MKRNRWLATTLAAVMATGAVVVPLGSAAATNGTRSATLGGNWNFHTVVPAADQPDDYFITDQIARADLDPTGLPIDTYLTTRIASQGGEERVVLIPNSTTNVEYLNQRGRPQVQSNGIDVGVGGSQPQMTLVRALFDKPMPVAIHAEYTLNGEVVDPDQVIGESGELKVSYLITNTDVQQETLTYQDSAGKSHTTTEPVLPPFVGTLTATLPENFQPTKIDKATASTDAEGNTLLNWNLLVYPPLGTNEQRVSFTAQVDEGQVPGLLFTMMPVPSNADPATKFSADLLEQSVNGNKEMTAGVEQLNTQTLTLAKAAAELSAGLIKVADGMNEADQEVENKLVPGAIELNKGADGLALGLTELSAALDAFAKEGLPLLGEGAQQLLAGAEELADAVGSPTDPPIPLPTPTITPTPTVIPTPIPTPTPTVPSVTLVQAARAATAATKLLRDQLVVLNNELLPIIVTVGTAAADSQSAATDAGDAVSDLTPVIAALCNPPLTPPSQSQCDAMADAAASAGSAATTSGDVATDLAGAATDLGRASARASVLALGASGLLALLNGIEDGVEAVAIGLRSGSYEPGKQGLVEGLEELLIGLEEAILGAELLAKNGQLLEEGAILLASGTEANVLGTEAVARGLALLATSTDQAAAGATDLASGAAQLQEQGTAKLLESIIASSKQPALAVAWLKAADKRAKSALPYGLPEGATGSAAYVMTMAPQGPSQTSGWLIVGLVLLLVAAIGGAVVKQLRNSS